MEIVTSADTFRSVVDLLLFHSLDRQVYSRLVRGLQQDPQNVKRAMALWMWLESIGHNDFVRHVNSYRDDLLIGFLKEAEMCINAVMGWLPSGCDRSIPLTAWLIDEPIDLGFFLFNRQIVFNGVARIYATVCDVIFNDSLMLVISQDGRDVQHGGVVKGGFVVQPSEDWMSRHGAALGPVAAGVVGKWGMVAFTDPEAATAFARSFRKTDCPFDCEATGPPTQERRSIFISFSRGLPISEREIVAFFHA